MVQRWTSTGGAYVAFNVRTVTDGNTSQINSVGGTTPPYWVELVRSGSTLSSYASPDGANWTLVGNQTVNMAQNVDVGLMMSSGSNPHRWPPPPSTMLPLASAHRFWLPRL